LKNFFEKLNSIDWQEMNATHVAQWLKDLASDDTKTRLNAYHNLDSQVIDPGSQSWEQYGPLSEVLKTQIPFLIVPLLIQALEQDAIIDKGNVLELLADLANKIFLSIDTLSDANDRAKAGNLYYAIREGIPVYRKLYQMSPDTSVRKIASEILKLCGEASE
jgi:hypothetical protein